MAMAVTLKQICQYLDTLGWHYEVEDRDDVQIVAEIDTETIQSQIVIALKEAGEYFELTAPNILAREDVVNTPFKEALFQTLLSINWETKFVQWEYDVCDDEIRATIEFPLEDSQLTQRQFERCLFGLVQVLDDALPRLLAVLETGQDPGDPDLDELLLLKIQDEMPGLLSRLERAIENRKRRGAFPKLSS
jgi:hypothetical protein